MTKQNIILKRQKEWNEHGRWTYGKKSYAEHPKGYCGDQFCCWGNPKDKVRWA